MKSFFRSAVTYFDIYSIGVNLNFKQREMHKSLFGGIISLFSFILIGLICWVYGKELILKQNPIIIQSLREVILAKRIQVDKSNIIMMIGIQDSFSKSFVDPTYFQVSAVLQQMVKSIDPKTGLPIKKLVSYSREISQCDLSDVGIESLNQYFQKFNYKAYFCLKSNGSDQQNFIEGDFDQDEFSQMYVYIKKCTNSTLPNSVICKAPDQIAAVMGSTKVSLYLSDQLITPTSYENPLMYKGINLFSHISSSFQKEIQLYYSNSYIDTDSGIFYKDFQQTRGFQFSEIREVQFYDQSQVMCRVLLRLRKQKEDYMIRRYQKFVDVAAQIGGLLKLITMVGALLVTPFQKFHFNKMIVNEIFSFQTQEQIIETKNDCKQSSSQGPSIQQIPNHKNELQLVQSKRNIEQKRDKSSSNFVIKSQRRGGNFLSQVLKIFKVTKDAIHYNFSDYFSHFVCPRNKSMQIKKPLLDYSIKKVQENLDILYILNKMIEIDKLKYILFDDDQLKLFEYIPKPKITIFDTQVFDKVDILDTESLQTKNKKNSNIVPKFYFSADKTQNQKAEDAQKSLLKIYQKQYRSKIDHKLLNSVDPNLFNVPSNNNLLSKFVGAQTEQTQLDISPPNQTSITTQQQQIFNFLQSKNPIFSKETNHNSIFDHNYSQQISQYKNNHKLEDSCDEKVLESNDEKINLESYFKNELDGTGINLVKNNPNFFENFTQVKLKKNQSVKLIKTNDEISISKSMGDIK